MILDNFPKDSFFVGFVFPIVDIKVIKLSKFMIGIDVVVHIQAIAIAPK